MPDEDFDVVSKRDDMDAASGERREMIRRATEIEEAIFEMNLVISFLKSNLVVLIECK